MAKAPPLQGFFKRLAGSFATKLAVLLVIFVSVSAIVYGTLQAAYTERNRLLLATIQEEGLLVTQALRPLLETFQGQSADDLIKALDRIGTGATRVKLLFRPGTATSPESFFYVASAPAVSAAYLDQEKREMIQRGILDKLAATCEGGRQLSLHHINPVGEEEILTSITPVKIAAGCWIVLTSRELNEDLTLAFGGPYWKTAEMQVAGALYLAMVLIVLSMFLEIWRNIRQFADHARKIRTGKTGNQSFTSLNRVPELDGVAEEFDHLVATLHRSAERIRQTAEENAHALKAPLAVISQSIEPLRPLVQDGDDRRKRSLELIERSVAKLDALISAARKTDEISAAAIDAVHHPVDLSRLIDTLVLDFAEPEEKDAPRVCGSVIPGIVVQGSEEMLETVIENLIDNALSFSPPNGLVRINLERQDQWTLLMIEDDGPGVSPESLDLIFKRYVSNRPGTAEEDHPGTHFGIGLWVAKRNIEALGGTIRAENSKPTGLRINIRLPLAA